MSWDLASSWWMLALLGVAAGALSGSLGIGSGIIVVPALVLLLGCPQKSAQGMALALMVPMAALGVWQYLRAPGVQMNWGVVALLVLGATVGVLAGTRLMARVPNLWLQRAFAVFLLIVAARMLWSDGARRAAPGASTPAAEKQTDGSK